MKHYELTDWKLYTAGEMSSNYQNEMEDHLYSCSQCLDLYMQAVNEENIPNIQESHFTDKVMAKLTEERGVKQGPGGSTRASQPGYKIQLTHYILAAAATLVLMFSGVFQSITGAADTAGSIEPETNKPSYTEKFITKTFAWKDSLEQNKEEDE